MDLDDISTAVLQELWKKVSFSATDLITQTNDVIFEKQSFKSFSNHISRLTIILESLHHNTRNFDSTKTSLEALLSLLNKARNIIKHYNSRSKLRFMLSSHSVLKQMQQLGQEIANTISLMELTNLDSALCLKSEIESIHFSSSPNNEVVSEVEKSLLTHQRNREHTMKLMKKIAEASGTSLNTELVQNEIVLLKKEKEEMEVKKKQAEALQLSQLIGLLENRGDFPESFRCPVSNEVMKDPVAILCGHSFERNSIQDHFQQGGSTCPVCEEKLSSMELTPNLSLRGSIREWKEKDTEMKFENALSGLISSEYPVVTEALKNLQDFIEIPGYRVRVSEKKLITKMVEFLQQNTNTHSCRTAVKCLYHLSCHCDENKEIMVEAGIMRYIVESFYKGEEEDKSEAILILVELSRKETLVETIGNVKNCILLLVRMLHNENLEVGEKAEMVLENLSVNTHFVIKMAEAGYFKPFVTRFNDGTFEIQASMAASIVNTQIGENNIKSFQQKEFICKLVKMLSSNSPAYIIACLKSMKKLLVYPEMVKWFLEETTTISNLINLVGSERHWEVEATEVLTSLVENIELSDFQKYPSLQQLQSGQNVNLLVSLVITSEAQLKVKILELLVTLACKSEAARELVRSNKEGISNLFASLSDESEERQEALKLIYAISENGVPLPPTPTKEIGINALVRIFTSSTNNIERSTAAGIISHLSSNDIIIDDILRRSEVLKTIHKVLSVDNEDSLIENSLAALLRCTNPTKPELQKKVCELEMYLPLVRILSNGTSLAKEYAATALADLSHPNINSVSLITFTESNDSNDSLLNMFFCCLASKPKTRLCSLHGSSCSSRNTLCLVKANAVKPLIQTLSDTQSGAVEAALIALKTMLEDNRTVKEAANVIVDNQGVAAVLEVMEKGTLSAKDKALELFYKLIEHTKITNTQSERAERILIHLLAHDELKKRTALVLRQMNILPEQSSYF